MRAIALAALTPLILAATAPEPSAIRVTVAASDGGAVRAGVPLRIDVSARDPATGYPLTAMTPALWLVPDDEEPAGGRCERLVNRLAASAAPPEDAVDANGFDLVQATEDGRLALVDPLLNLASANIKAMLETGGVPIAWAIDPGGGTLAVASLRDPALLMIDMNRFAIMRRAVLDAAPTALVTSGDAFWAGTAAGHAVPVDAGGRTGAPVAIGTGAVQLAAADTTVVAVAGSGDGAFLHGSGPAARFALGTQAGALVYAPLADAAYVLAADGSALFFVPQDQPDAPRRIALTRPARALALSPDGRWIALVAADGGAVTIFDVAAAHERWTINANDPVVAASFSDAFLYLAHKRQGGATRVVFDPEGGPPGTVTIAAGSTGDQDETISALPVMAPIPRAGMLVASPRDRTAYMINDDNAQAAMSSLPLRAGKPVGILLRYRGLAPGRDKGDYSTQIVAPRGGRYQAVVRTEQPAMAHCAAVAVLPAPGEPVRAAGPRAAPTPRALTVAAMPAGGAQALRFAVSGPPVQLIGATLVGDGWQLTPPDIRSERGGYVMPVDLPPGRDVTLFVRYRDGAGEAILEAPVGMTGR